MTSTTVRIQDVDKSELDKLQASIVLRTGKKLSYDQLLHYLLKHAKGKVIEEIVDDVTDQEIDWDGIMNDIKGHGKTDATNADKVIYGK